MTDDGFRQVELVLKTRAKVFKASVKSIKYNGLHFHPEEIEKLVEKKRKECKLTNQDIKDLFATGIL